MALKTAGTGQPVPAVYVITKWRKIGKVRADDRFILLWYTDLNKKYENELKMKIPDRNRNLLSANIVVKQRNTLEVGSNSPTSF